MSYIGIIDAKCLDHSAPSLTLFEAYHTALHLHQMGQDMHTIKLNKTS